MFNKVLKVALFLFVFLFPFNLFAGVTDLNLKLPFPGGDWQEISGTFSPGQQLEASWFISNKGDETIDYFESY